MKRPHCHARDKPGHDGVCGDREKRHERSRKEPLPRDLRARETDPEGFWAEAAKEIDWIKPAKKIFDASQGVYGRWFTGAVVNTCYNALDRHVAGGRADQVALIHDSPLTGSVTKFTYREMLDEVKTLAAIMADFGVAKGDRVIIYMPLVPEAVIGMLACARIGAVHSVVFGGFAAKELATRIDDAEPKLIFSASCGVEPGRIVRYKPLLDEAINLSKRKAAGLHRAAAAAGDLFTGRRPRSRLGRAAKAGDRAEEDAPTACRSLRPIRSTSSTHPARREFRKASCATMAGIWSR